MTEISVAMQRVIGKLDEEVGLLETSLANATDEIEALRAENAELRQLSFLSQEVLRHIEKLDKENAELRGQIVELVVTLGMHGIHIQAKEEAKQNETE